jgi:hypothetical protein
VLGSGSFSSFPTQAIVDAVEEGDIEKYQQVSVLPASKQRETCRVELFLFSNHVTRFTVFRSQAVQEFDTIQKLDAWMTTVLLHIKKSMDGDEVL